MQQLHRIRTCQYLGGQKGIPKARGTFNGLDVGHSLIQDGRLVSAAFLLAQRSGQ